MTWEIRQGDVREKLRELPYESVQTCVTSPPYWGLRDYGTGAWEGGDPECDHLGEPFRTRANVNANTGRAPDQKNTEHRQPMGETCAKCGATRIDSQLGLEPTPEQYVANMVEVFREVRRVLRGDGTLWLNLGDSYSGGNRGEYADGRINGYAREGTHRRPIPAGKIKPKDLVGIPWRVAFALQADGWYLRSDIIWAKPNPMPESVTDRPTKAHEYLFLLTRSPRYFYDADAIREPHSQISIDRVPRGRNPGHKWEDGPGRHTLANDMTQALHPNGRNKRSVWNIATRPYAEAHFATFPPDLVEPCILAGSPPGATVLDPFSGAATTGVVACRLDRSFIGIELNPEYVEMGRNRIRDDAPLLNTPLEAAA